MTTVTLTRPTKSVSAIEVEPIKIRIALTDFLALTDDPTVERELIAGVLNERDWTPRNSFHTRMEARVAFVLNSWRCQQPEPRGDVLSGEAGFTLERDPGTSVGIDIAYVSAEVAASQTFASSMMRRHPDSGSRGSLSVRHTGRHLRHDRPVSRGGCEAGVDCRSAFSNRDRPSPGFQAGLFHD